LAAGLGNEDAGHIVGKTLGGAGVPDNIIAQNISKNRGEYRTFENNIKDLVKQHGEVKIDVRLAYPTGSSKPIEINYFVYDKNGKQLDFKQFRN
jgi:hypothetical protein